MDQPPQSFGNDQTTVNLGVTHQAGKLISPQSSQQIFAAAPLCQGHPQLLKDTVPDEVAVRREIAELETLLEPTGPTALAARARLRLGVLRARLAIARGEGSAWVAECAYMERLIERFDRD